MTQRLYSHVEKEAFNHPYAYVADTTGLDGKTVRDIFKKKAEFLAAWHRFETPRCLGIDELYLNRRYRCTLTNLEERTLLDLLLGRQQDAVAKRLMSMSEREKVEIVSMDMWKPCRAAVQAVLPQARIVDEKFHVVRMANEALKKIRKGLRKELTVNQRRTLKGEPEDPAEARLRCLRPRASHHGDLDRDLSLTPNSLRVQGVVLTYLGLCDPARC